MPNNNQIAALLLAAGFGSRLRPLTNEWPKCLMPIGEKPLLEYWLSNLHNLGITDVLVNTHYKNRLVEEFLERDHLKEWVKVNHETELLGTAGTLKRNAVLFKDKLTLLIHADNWCQCDFSEFINHHVNKRSKGTLITMMTFTTQDPKECGVVELNDDVVIGFHEKVKKPPSNVANAAVYILEPAIIDWIQEQKEISDFSNHVLPNFIGKISAWHNYNIHRDIGSFENLYRAQSDKRPKVVWNRQDQWHKDFLVNPIHSKVKALEETYG